MAYVVDEVKFDGNGLVPVITQDFMTGEVLMLAYMNREALEKSIETGMVHYWSRNRQKLWLKGETSGHFQYMKSLSMDCDGDALLVKVDQKEAACHTGHHSCFFRQMDGNDTAEVQDGKVEPEDYDKPAILQELYEVIKGRQQNPKEGSYTNYLFEKGLDKILKKVGEETAEVIIAAKNKSREEIRYEVADLIYHLFVLLVERDIKLDEIYEELKGRR
jgi:phosphoribosyl-ATP pyrophosphohydrolase/phosphoribosyl-AMP cyclohydrolase